ncbi:non-ribosomal peptide synthetase [Nocardiopsis tropica]|uniref:Amino acid adenylation domain-containing protein n=1 Tax=Nocardiopsis tropica TaxID=109330 RepID=A0ABV2A502_9ACTN
MTLPPAPSTSPPEPAGATEPLPAAVLPWDRPAPARRELRAGSVAFEVPAPGTAGLRALADEAGGGPEAAALALYLVLLHRYGGPRDLVVAVPGPSGGTLLTRTRVTGAESFRELVDRAGQSLRRAKEDGRHHQQGATALPWPGFGLTRSDGPPETGGSPEPVRTTRCDLDVRLTDHGDRLAGRVVYAADVFDEATARRACGHLLRLLEGVTGSPDRAVRDLPVLTAEEERLTAALNSTETAVPAQPFHELFEAQARRTPDAVAVRTPEAALTYSELDRRANQLSHLLREQGVGAETTVGLCSERGARLVVAVLGILKAGGAYVPLEPADPAERRAAILADAAVRTVVTTDPALSFGPGRGVVELDRDWSVLRGRPDDRPAEGSCGLETAAYLLYTSGSTGRPKGVVIEHRQLLSYTFAVIDRFGLREPLSFAMVQPLTVDSSVTALVPPLCTGGQVHLIPRETALDADRLADWVRDRGVDCLKIAPSHLRALQSSPRFAELLPRRLLIVGGEPSDWRWLRGIQRSVPHCRVYNHYGPTETTVGVLALAVGDHLRAEWDTAPIGVPLPNTRAHVVDAAGQQVPTGVSGELLIGGANLARGYHDRADLTREAFVPDTLGPRAGERLYRTGDIVRRLPDGTIAFLGRRDDQIKVRGFRVELGEIDSALKSHPQVRNATTVVRDDLAGGRGIVAYVEPHSPASFDRADLERHLGERIPPHMVPQAVVPMERLPLSGHGKVARSALPPVPAPTTAASAPLPPSNGLERLVADAWRELLGVEEVGMEQNFFDLGGHSLLLVELQHRLRAGTGRDIDLLGLFQHTTVRAQAAFLASGEPEQPPPPEAARGAQQNALLRRRQQQLRAKRGRA